MAVCNLTKELLRPWAGEGKLIPGKLVSAPPKFSLLLMTPLLLVGSGLPLTKPSIHLVTSCIINLELFKLPCSWFQAMAQVGGLVMLQPEVGGSRENFFFAGIDKVRFRKPVVAGDTLVMRMTLIKLQKRFGIAKMEGKAYVGGEVVCEGEFLMATGS
ncbi:3-hydroxyacyl-[acyl-carrier-protein] dehydratase FabZ [Vitis vinifera]|uniref:3-hydroxyacyl-[acyl-carrier-protein] dehydratase FabZ n=1 Tax=Vitis vinifera TaxID=29760 RepID=A0A438GRQ2_VITVI|nr:3-hydroxyacyl-[acyl-carrier-protein] dehydratase FabZ [Vitis vinifera]